MTKNIYPEWVSRHKVAGTAIHKIKDNYYLYKITSKWNSEKKRSVKITEGIIGKITPEGLVTSQPRVSTTMANKIGVVEFGMTDYLHQNNKDVLGALEHYFPNEGKELFLMGMYRLAFQSSLKNMEEHYANSYIKEELKDAKLNKSKITQILKTVGSQRNQIVSMLQSLYKEHSSVLIDQTHIASFSSYLLDNQVGYNSQKCFDPQVNLLLLFSVESKMPLFYRVTAGNIREVSSLGNTISQSGLKQAIIISDKGFFSYENEQELDNQNLNYIMPLRRNHKFCDYTPVKQANKNAFSGRFTFNDRVIWYTSYVSSGRTLVLYLDEQLKVCEQKDYLDRLDQGIDGYTQEGFFERQYKFGTITLVHNLGKNVDPQTIFNHFKTRNDVEVAFNTFKNILMADASHMRSPQSNETWFLINFIALIMYYRLFNALSSKKLIHKFSPSDILLFLQQIKKLSINNSWVDAEITQKNKKVLNLLLN